LPGERGREKKEDSAPKKKLLLPSKGLYWGGASRPWAGWVGGEGRVFQAGSGREIKPGRNKKCEECARQIRKVPFGAGTATREEGLEL